MTKLLPGRVRDAVEQVMREAYPDPLDVPTIRARVSKALDADVPRSSVVSSLNLRNDTFTKVGRGKYVLVNR